MRPPESVEGRPYIVLDQGSVLWANWSASGDDKLTGALHSPPHEGDGITLSVRTYSISIDRNWQVFYEAIWQPEIFLKWAPASLSPIFVRAGPDGLPMVRSRSASRPIMIMA
jgi:hypothetical protein